jgi:hypothetical protein
MGCDIHAYVEYTEGNRETPYWMSVGKDLNLGRDYDLFGKIAGVRLYEGNAAMLPLRGLPEAVSLTVGWENILYVSEDGDGDSYCSRASAERWVAEGTSEWANDRKSSVTNPDHHSHSWCSTAEFRSVLEAPRQAGWSVRPAWFAVLAMMEELERRDCDARLVFWFDN